MIEMPCGCPEAGHTEEHARLLAVGRYIEGLREMLAGPPPARGEVRFTVEAAIVALSNVQRALDTSEPLDTD